MNGKDLAEKRYPNDPAELFVVRVGTGPQTVNLDGPDADGDRR